MSNIALPSERPAHAALASEASGQRGDSIVRAPDTRPEPGPSARAAWRAPNSQPSDDDLRAKRCSASRLSSCARAATTASWASSRSILPAATRTEYCTETETDMSG
jgi:hypothetical protein